MIDYKLVPLEPTYEMALAAMNAETQANYKYGEPADFLSIWRAMLAAAPAVQGEPVAYLFPDEVGRTKIVLGKETAEHWCPPDESITPLYAAPQHSPPLTATPEMEQAAEKYWNERRFKALSDNPRTWAGLYEAMVADAPQPVEQQPAPDVSGLVEALEYLMGKYPASRHLQDTCAAALAAYRKGGDV